MFCPKCSQQQISDETIFCSRCGFQLSVVKALLSSDEVQPGRAAQLQQPADRSLRKRDMTIGAALMFVFALAVAAITIDMPSSHSARIIGLVVAWFALSLLINIMPIVRYFFHGDAAPSSDNIPAPKNLFNRTAQTENNFQNQLSAAQIAPTNDFTMPRGKTAEMIPQTPPSVTEDTTNLLKN